MAAHLIDGHALARVWREQIARDADELAGRGVRPSLATILVGDHPAARSFTTAQAKAAADVGIEHRLVRLSADAAPATTSDAIAAINADRDVHGVLLQLPVPASLDLFALQQQIVAEKDVEGVSALNLGRLFMGREALIPCTAAAAFECVRSALVDLAGKHAVVVGRSNIVGKPLASLLLAAHATVTQCHSRTQDLAEITRQASVLVAAAGRPGLIGREHIRPGAVVVDVGVNRVSDGHGGHKMLGDVRFDEASDVAGWITPVPGGVGPLTVTMLLGNVIRAARLALERIVGRK